MMCLTCIALANTLFFVPPAASGSPQCKAVLDIAETRGFPERSARIRSIYSLGEKAIPNLLQDIPSCRKASVILNAPTSSTVEGPLWQYCGVIAAYVVETFLSRADLALTDPPQPDVGFFLGSNSNDYVYKQGVIKRADGRLISCGDLRKIHELYWRWWQARKAKTLEQMREDWRNGSRPLTGSEFHWE